MQPTIAGAADRPVPAAGAAARCPPAGRPAVRPAEPPSWGRAVVAGHASGSARA